MNNFIFFGNVLSPIAHFAMADSALIGTSYFNTVLNYSNVDHE